MYYTSNRNYSKIRYATEQEKEAILSGEFFQTENQDYYYRLTSQNRTRLEGDPKDIVVLERMYNGSVHAPKCKWEYELVQDPNATIYFGETLKKRIFAHVKLWMKSIKPETGKAFRGRDFKSFIRALPKEFIADENFANTVLFVIRDTLVDRVKKSSIEEEIEGLVKFQEVASQCVSEAHNEGKRNKKGKEDVAESASQHLQEVRARAIAKMNGGKK